MGKIKEKTIQNEAFRTLKQFGHTSYRGRDHFAGVNSQNVETAESGIADLFFVRGTTNAAIEVKAFGTSFNFKDIRDNQIEWATTWWQSTQPGAADSIYWLWIGGGTDRPNVKAPTRRRTWLMTLNAFLYYRGYVSGLTSGMMTIPVHPDYYKSMSVVVRENNLFACSLFAPYELQWAGNKLWEISPQHPFRVMYQL